MELKIYGTIPTYAAGTLYRIGPGGYKLKADNGKPVESSHWFDGFSQLHRFQIQPSSGSDSSTKVFYNSRHTVDSVVENIRKTGKMTDFTFGQKRDPCESFFKKVQTTFTPLPTRDVSTPSSQNIGVTLSINMPGLPPPGIKSQKAANGVNSLVAKTDASAYQWIDPETLEPIGLASQTSLDPSLKGPLSAAHAKTDPATGDVFNYNLDVGSKATYRIFQVSASTGKTTILATITDAAGAYIHSLFLTEHFVVLCVWGSHYAYSGLKLIYTRNILDAIKNTDPSQPVRWYVVDRTHAQKGVVATYTSPSFYSFHTINAYEERNESTGKTDVLADLICYEDSSIIKRFYYDNLKSSSPGATDYDISKPRAQAMRPYLARYRLPSVDADNKQDKSGTATREWAAPSSSSVELPTLNPHAVTHKYRYVYGCTDNGGSSFFDGLAKFDLETQKAIYWTEKGQTGGEPIFVPNPGASGEDSEDDGVLLSVVLDGFRGTSYLLVLDAKNMQEVGRAELDAGKVVGFGFHGVHVPSQGSDKGKALDI